MPRIRDVRVRAVAEVAPAVRSLETARRALPKPEPRLHDPADHLSFRNADGTVSRICICACDRCWPPDAGKHPGPCPDWNDEDV
ncbi:hypothetical protein SEA_INTOLERANT_49 [Streptomyces phage Intolerant]|nr:hypothetical protein SEA_INTOLERANT_49 [Streptomyces phage Intolerant]